jgi:ferredoxin
MIAIIDKGLCIGCELCVQICPGVFFMAGDGFAEVLAGPVPAIHETTCKEAAESCPASAIMIEE